VFKIFFLTGQSVRCARNCSMLTPTTQSKKPHTDTSVRNIWTVPLHKTVLPVQPLLMVYSYNLIPTWYIWIRINAKAHQERTQTALCIFYKSLYTVCPNIIKIYEDLILKNQHKDGARILTTISSMTVNSTKLPDKFILRKH